jgi:hypothetical protein
MASIIFEGTIRSEANCRRINGRAWRPALVEETIPLRLGVYSEADIPLALRVSPNDKCAIEIRSYAGRFWAPYGAGEWISRKERGWHHERTNPRPEDWVFSPKTAPVEVLLAEHFQELSRTYAYGATLIDGKNRGEFRDIVVGPASREAELEKLYAKASDLLGFNESDGHTTLWEAVPELCWRIDRGFSSNRRAGIGDYCWISAHLDFVTSYEVRQHPERAYNLKDLEKGIAVARYGQSPTTRLDLTSPSKVEIIDGSMLSFDPLGIATRDDAVLAFLHEKNQDKMWSWTEEEFAAWAKFRGQMLELAPWLRKNMHYSDPVGTFRREKYGMLLDSSEQPWGMARAVMEYAPLYFARETRVAREESEIWERALHPASSIWSKFGLNEVRLRCLVEGVFSKEELYPDGDVPDLEILPAPRQV